MLTVAVSIVYEIGQNYDKNLNVFNLKSNTLFGYYIKSCFSQAFCNEWNFFVVLGFELTAYTLSHSASPFW
jgi:hypothetical protein